MSEKTGGQRKSERAIDAQRSSAPTWFSRKFSLSAFSYLRLGAWNGEKATLELTKPLLVCYTNEPCLVSLRNTKNGCVTHQAALGGCKKRRKKSHKLCSIKGPNLDAH